MKDERALKENRALIRSALGEVWSGRARYAAAVWFFQHGLMDATVLETYRILSRLDHEDPQTLLMQSSQGRQWAEELNKSTEA